MVEQDSPEDVLQDAEDTEEAPLWAASPMEFEEVSRGAVRGSTGTTRASVGAQQMSQVRSQLRLGSPVPCTPAPASFAQVETLILSAKHESEVKPAGPWCQDMQHVRCTRPCVCEVRCWPRGCGGQVSHEIQRLKQRMDNLGDKIQSVASRLNLLSVGPLRLALKCQTRDLRELCCLGTHT